MPDQGGDDRIERSGLRPLSETECWELLSRQDLGRIAFVIDGWPQVFPVNYAVSETVLVFKTASGTKATHGPGSRACFEVDHWDDRIGSGWSVMVQGVLRDVTDAVGEQAEALRELSLHPAAPGSRDRLLALESARVSGRRFGSPGIVRPLPF